MNDVTFDALHGMLRGLAERQRATADNIANLETPNYTAKRVEFEGALRSALDAGRSADVAPSIVNSTAGRLPNGNNVSLEQEVIVMEETSLKYELAIEAVTAKLNLLRSSMRNTL